MASPGRLFHGGLPGLRPGDRILPVEDGQRRHRDDCAVCQARNSGESTPYDPAPARPDRVYLTSDRLYARYYASLTGLGDLYVVRPLGELEPSPEDHFPTWTAPAAEVTAVYDRAVSLTMGQRRQLLRLWIEADAAADGTLEHYRAMSPADRRRLFDRNWRLLWQGAAHAVEVSNGG